MDLYPFQIDGVHFLQSRRSALLADDMGLGKSPQAIKAFQKLNAKSVLIICPASVKYNWRKECIKWGVPDETIFILDKSIVKNIVNMSGIFIINYDIAYRREYARYMIRRRYDVLICDEAHALKNHKTKRSKSVFGDGGYKDVSTYRWMLTGTPVLNRPVELHAMLSALAPELLGRYINYIEFTKRFCNGHDGNWGWDASGATNIQELSEKLSSFMLRRERDVLPDLPECIMGKVYIENTPEIERHIFEERKGKETESIRKKLGLAKCETIKQYIDTILETENKVVIFAYHIEVIETLTGLLSEYNPVFITGAVSAKNRFERVNTFKSRDDVRLFIGQIDAAGIGIDGLQDFCHHIVFAEISYVPGMNLQAMGRVHRHGQTHKTIVDFITIEDSLDEDIINKNILKEEVIKELLQDEDTKLKFNEQTENEGEGMETELTLKMKISSDESTKCIDEIVKTLSGFGVVDKVTVEYTPAVRYTECATQPIEHENPDTDQPAQKKVEKRGRKKKNPENEIHESWSVGAQLALPGMSETVNETIIDSPIDSVLSENCTASLSIGNAETPAAPEENKNISLSAEEMSTRYDTYVTNASKAISNKLINPAEIQKMFSEIRRYAKEKYPACENLLTVTDPKDQIEIKIYLKEIMKGLGI